MDTPPTASREPAITILAVAASAGGLSALTYILQDLPATVPVPMVVVQHLDPRHRSMMPDILTRRTGLRVREAAEGDHLVPGSVFVAPPDRHLLVNPDRTVSLSQSELVHFVRPSADLLFESVAASHRAGALVLVLTGSGRDGSMGLKAVKKMGGIVMVQDPASCQFSGMPEAAIRTGHVDILLPLQEIPSKILTLLYRGDVHGKAG